jgi:glycosyltransferase involved in cell wall biosynthesis
VFSHWNKERATARPLRVLCAGGLREEKGLHELAHLMEKMSELGFAAGQLQFWVQAKRASRVPVAAEDRYVLTCLDQQPPASARVVCVPHPLQPNDYVQLLNSAHVGLFLYDPERYYTRCSGILLELLTAGVPVIVPSGCWLGEQLQHPAACGVGLIANDRSEVPRCLAEMTRQYEYYAASARAFAPKNFAMHRPIDVIATLQRTAVESRKGRVRAA